MQIKCPCIVIYITSIAIDEIQTPSKLICALCFVKFICPSSAIPRQILRVQNTIIAVHLLIKLNKLANNCKRFCPHEKIIPLTSGVEEIHKGSTALTCM